MDILAATKPTSNHPSLLEPETAVVSTLRRWIRTREDLSSAVQSYLSASAAPHAACSGALISSAQNTQLEDALAHIGSQFDTLRSEEQALRSTRTHLSKLRNNSVALSPVNKLPPEVLSYIFALSKNDCLFELPHDSKHRQFVAVCTYWRQLALSKGNLWSHIDVSLNCPGGPALEWSGDSPIHVHAYEPIVLVDGNPERTSTQATRAVIAALTPHIHRVYSLYIELLCPHHDFTDAILTLWLGRTDATLARSLSIHCPHFRDNLRYLDFNNGWQVSRDVGVHSENVLSSLTTLHLTGVEFDWCSDAFRGLVDLRLATSFELNRKEAPCDAVCRIQT